MDDSGNILDHTIVAGQVHGSVAMGVGQAMLEQTVYDDGGQLVSASFMDYAMPRAHHLPMFKDDVYEVPATTNPLGVKGAGEAGTTAAIAAVMNAFADAIPGRRAQDPDAGDAGEGVEGVPGDGGLTVGTCHQRHSGACAKARARNPA